MKENLISRQMRCGFAWKDTRETAYCSENVTYAVSKTVKFSSYELDDHLSFTHVTLRTIWILEYALNFSMLVPFRDYHFRISNELLLPCFCKSRFVTFYITVLDWIWINRCEHCEKFVVLSHPMTVKITRSCRSNSGGTRNPLMAAETP